MAMMGTMGNGRFLLNGGLLTASVLLFLGFACVNIEKNVSSGVRTSGFKGTGLRARSRFLRSHGNQFLSRQTRVFEKRDERGFLVDDELTYDTNVYCQSLGGTAQLKFSEAATEYADKIKSSPQEATAESLLNVIREEFEYLPVSFSFGNSEVAKGDKEDMSKILSFCILSGIPIETVSSILNEPELASKGWGYVKFPNGLSTIPKDSARDIETDPNQLLKETDTLMGSGDWDPNSDVWIP
mmetsp:Transcript_9530/g.14313  ORF Transcript_9530/g.14313 Transcript_9530/m.14313 type:complete len:241 (+) Transcript_9530:31-753(+)|eukprot:CAMPEP_0167752356 /NCGR_PEP_ID=MMETSP0110_2-20121227/7094_1 /TAXON_ID=629695 /ORGANISM="Gymnochlora sp., Strain CCMP2014" /LENGTH=240 /DNA_ID=CAMNT_0007637965 /DNA_START=20 /DNA_END=742 /DNA_ORIENTATION=-